MDRTLPVCDNSVSLTIVPSLILDLNGIQFAVQTVLLLMIGPYADYGTWRPWLLICKSTLDLS